MLLHLAEHDDAAAVELPHHLPEVGRSALQGALSGDVGPPLLVALGASTALIQCMQTHTLNAAKRAV